MEERAPSNDGRRTRRFDDMQEACIKYNIMILLVQLDHHSMPRVVPGAAAELVQLRDSECGR
jgi:hypothetical protein